MKFELTVLGSNSAIPAHGRNLSAQVLSLKDEIILIDCGEGTQMQLAKYGIKYSKINHIFISHLHGDHIFGLIGLLTNFSLKKRTKLLTIYSPEGLEELIQTQIKLIQTPLSYPLVFIKTNPTVSELILNTSKFSVTTIPLQHRVPCNGYLFRENNKQRRINKELIDHYNIPYNKIAAIKQGEDYLSPKGELLTHLALTLAPFSERSYAYCSDTMYKEDIVWIIKEIDLLYHEATFLQEHLDKATKTMHTTALQAATIAQKAKVKALLIGHFSSRYQDIQELEKEAQTLFPNAQSVVEGNVYKVGR